MTEEWRDIVGFEGMYQVSNIGRVKSLPRPMDRKKGNHPARIRGKMMTIFLDGLGRYPIVHLYKNGKQKTCLVHRLVLISFTSNPKKGIICNHKNGIFSDNRLENLEWMTPSENNYHAYQVLGRVAIGADPENVSTAKLTWKQARRAREMHNNNPKRWHARTLGERFGLSTSAMGHLLRGTTWIER